MRINPKNATHIPISDGTRSFIVMFREMGLRWAHHQSEYLGHTENESSRMQQKTQGRKGATAIGERYLFWGVSLQWYNVEFASQGFLMPQS
eukprot:scaffold10160_cov79-Cylindrotheca_fusiformis.AAC.2